MRPRPLVSACAPPLAAAAAAAALAAAGPALAKPRLEQPPASAPAHEDLWSRITDPHGDEVRLLVAKARLAMRRADDARTGEEDWAVDQRARFYRDAYSLAAHARALAPENPLALVAFARAAEELGRTGEAIAALELHARLAGPDPVGLEAAAHLGALYLRAGDLDRAIRWLRLAEGPLSPLSNDLDRACALVHLATALTGRGELPAAIHALVSALPERASGNTSREATLVGFALAVLYDRDEQRAAAFDVLDDLQAALGAQYQPELQLALARMPFVPPEELHYYRALLYESLDRYAEARAEWALYAAAGPPFRARALDHVAAIDEQRRDAQTRKRLQQSPAPRPRPR